MGIFWHFALQYFNIISSMEPRTIFTFENIPEIALLYREHIIITILKMVNTPIDLYEFKEINCSYPKLISYPLILIPIFCKAFIISRQNLIL